MTFEFLAPTRILFGAGKVRELPAVLGGLGRRGLLVTGADPARLQTVQQGLRAAGLDFAVWSVGREPTVADAVAGAEFARACGATWVAAIGGGSVLDGGKAIAALGPNPGDPLEYLEVVGRGRPLPQAPLPLVAVPTTAGTGSEVTRNAVLNATEHRVKVSLRSPLLFPRVALLDPELALSLPPAATAAAGMDAIVQLIEPFICRRAQPITDALCREGLRLAGAAFPRVMSHPSDAAARGSMALAALFSGYALANAGLGAVHGLAGVLGGALGAPHGAVCARLLAPTLQLHLQAAPPTLAEALRARLGEAAHHLTGEPHADPAALVAWAESQCARHGIPRLGAMGLSAAQIPAIAAQGLQASSMKANPYDPTQAQLEAVLAAAR